MNNDEKKILPSEGAISLVNVGIAEGAPEASARGVFEAERGRVFEEEEDVGELGLEAREESREGLGVAPDVLVARTLVMIQLANRAILELMLLFLLPLLHSCVGFRVRVRVR